jgi:4-oxalocrotonate tautomerase family enzyme
MCKSIARASEENKKKLVEGMTSVLVELGVPREAVTVIIYEAPKANWASRWTVEFREVRKSLDSMPTEALGGFQRARCIHAIAYAVPAR